MRALITGYHESTTCMWCEKSTEAVTVQFDGGFLKAGELCWKCLQQATRVQHKQRPDDHSAKPNQNE